MITKEEQRKKWRENPKNRMKERESQKKYYDKKIEEDKDYNKKRHNKRKDTEIYKKAHRKSNSKYARNNKEKLRAKDLAQAHIELKGLCERCGKVPAEHRHHPDYTKPLYVKLVCSKCHREIHKEGTHGKTFINKTKHIEKKTTDKICANLYTKCDRLEGEIKGMKRVVEMNYRKLMGLETTNNQDEVSCANLGKKDLEKVEKELIELRKLNIEAEEILERTEGLFD